MSALLISLEKREKNETVRRGEGREMKRLNKIRICMKRDVAPSHIYTLFLLNLHFSDTFVVIKL